MTSEIQHIPTPITFGSLGFAISIYAKGSLKIGILSINKMSLELHRSTQPTSTLGFYYQIHVSLIVKDNLDCFVFPVQCYLESELRLRKREMMRNNRGHI